ncbi:MAG: PDZ domain-containing protein [Planctomycetaceae bacterium]|jgi:carboxyl-terminal processing protease|nr:PDZ domain-containing protein [Planctomycetaceae bacterium]
MPRLNYYVIIFSLLLCFFCYPVTIRDRVLVNTLHWVEWSAFVSLESRQLFEGAMNGMFKTLDKYSYYTPAVGKKDYNDHLNNLYEGIGLITMSTDDNKSLEVIYPLFDSPAFRAGLRSGDRILAVNGTDLTEDTVREFSSLIKKLSGTDIELSVLQFGKTEPVKIAIRADQLNMDSVEGDNIDVSGSRDFLLETNNNIGYIRITSFSRRTADEFGDALQQLYQKQAQGLILDLRGNPGGYVNISVEIATLLLNATDTPPIIVSTKYRNGIVKKNYYGNSKNQICSLPMVVLIDDGSASASEILAAALQDYQRCVIVGNRSFGKGVVQEIHDLPANSGTFQLTDVSYWRPSNKNINRTENAVETDDWGVIPDFECKMEMQKWRSLTIDSIRTRRANAICENRETFLDSYLANVEKNIDKLRNEINELNKTETQLKKKFAKSIEDDKNKTDNTENKIENENNVVDKNEDNENMDIPFKLQGNKPYFDPQLDKAIEILEKMISGKSVAEIIEQKDKDEP